MQLNDFSGGLSLRKGAHLINANQAVTYTNVDNERMSLGPLKSDKYESTVVTKSLYYFNSLWLYSNDDRDYVEFQNVLYYSDGSGIPQKTSDGSTFNNLGIDNPSAAPSVSLGSAGNLNGTYQYCYTYYNVNDGTESAPSDYSSEISPSYQQVDIGIVASTDIQVTNIRIYRIGGNLTAMSLVEQVDNTTTTYTDNLADDSIDGAVLDSFNYNQAPSGLKYLIESNAMFFGADGVNLRFTDIAFPNYWSAFNYIPFPDTITGIGEVANGILVFTDHKTYIVTGTSPETLSKYLLDGSQGCLLHKSIQQVQGALAWLSNDGICLSSGGVPQVITTDVLGKLSLTSPKVSILYDNVYYLSHSDGSLVIDFRYNSIVRDLDITPDSWHIKDDILYYSLGGALYSLGTDSGNKTFTWKSPKLADGGINIVKTYKRVTTYVEDDTLTMDVFIYDIEGNIVEVLSNYVVKVGYNQVDLPQGTRKGYMIQFQLTGSGNLLELDYSGEGIPSITNVETA